MVVMHCLSGTEKFCCGGAGAVVGGGCGGGADVLIVANASGSVAVDVSSAAGGWLGAVLAIVSGEIKDGAGNPQVISVRRGCSGIAADASGTIVDASGTIAEGGDVGGALRYSDPRSELVPTT